ncbi:MAG TPA: preprotein translocase subunit SecE [Gemmatimonadaceae bacterium]|jgi:preprotein translocase subunit SecE|nr:preprotein translocase subunit SecE [Gemmatimonadaceae bacterium]
MADAVARNAASGGGGPKVPGEPGFGGKLVNFYHGVIAEMKKVTWPDVPQVRSATISIIIFVLILGLLITILDFALQGILIRGIPSLFAGR